MNQEHPFGAEFRHQQRIHKWRKATTIFPKFRHDIWWWLHNIVSHPWLGVWPNSASIWFHDFTSQRLNRRRKLMPSPSPNIPDFFLWAQHNILAHVAIGLFPCKATFDWHDRTADEMNVEDWV